MSLFKNVLPLDFFLIMQAITGDSVLLKFEKARCALEDSLKRVDDIVPQSIGCQVIIFKFYHLFICYLCMKCESLRSYAFMMILFYSLNDL